MIQFTEIDKKFTSQRTYFDKFIKKSLPKDAVDIWNGSRIWMQALLNHQGTPEASRELIIQWLSANKTDDCFPAPTDTDLIVVVPGASPVDLQACRTKIQQLDNKAQQALGFTDYQNFKIPVDRCELDITLRQTNLPKPIRSNFDIQVNAQGKILNSADEQAAFRRFVENDFIEIDGFSDFLYAVAKNLRKQVQSTHTINKHEVVRAAYLLKSLYKPLLLGKKMSLELATTITDFLRNPEFRELRQFMWKPMERHNSANKIPRVGTYYNILAEHADGLLNSHFLEKVATDKKPYEAELASYSAARASAIEEHKTLQQYAATTQKQKEQHAKDENIVAIGFTLQPPAECNTDPRVPFPMRLAMLRAAQNELPSIQTAQKAFRETVQATYVSNDKIISKKMALAAPVTPTANAEAGSSSIPEAKKTGKGKAKKKKKKTAVVKNNGDDIDNIDDEYLASLAARGPSDRDEVISTLASAFQKNGQTPEKILVLLYKNHFLKTQFQKNKTVFLEWVGVALKKTGIKPTAVFPLGVDFDASLKILKTDGLFGETPTNDQDAKKLLEILVQAYGSTPLKTKFYKYQHQSKNGSTEDSAGLVQAIVNAHPGMFGKQDKTEPGKLSSDEAFALTAKIEALYYQTFMNKTYLDKPETKCEDFIRLAINDTMVLGFMQEHRGADAYIIIYKAITAMCSLKADAEYKEKLRNKNALLLHMLNPLFPSVPNVHDARFESSEKRTAYIYNLIESIMKKYHYVDISDYDKVFVLAKLLFDSYVAHLQEGNTLLFYANRSYLPNVKAMQAEMVSMHTSKILRACFTVQVNLLKTPAPERYTYAIATPGCTIQLFSSLENKIEEIRTISKSEYADPAMLISEHREFIAGLLKILSDYRKENKLQEIPSAEHDQMVGSAFSLVHFRCGVPMDIIKRAAEKTQSALGKFRGTITDRPTESLKRFSDPSPVTAASQPSARQARL